jgi:hypothetical protein
VEFRVRFVPHLPHRVQRLRLGSINVEYLDTSSTRRNRQTFDISSPGQSRRTRTRRRLCAVRAKRNLYGGRHRCRGLGGLRRGDCGRRVHSSRQRDPGAELMREPLVGRAPASSARDSRRNCSRSAKCAALSITSEAIMLSVPVERASVAPRHGGWVGWVRRVINEAREHRIGATYARPTVVAAKNNGYPAGDELWDVSPQAVPGR